MSQKSLAPALQRWLTTQALRLLSDSELLDRFRQSGDEEAFATLLERHGPMVRGVCARLVRDAHDVEDAVQVTFLIFVRQAGTIRKGEAVASWLHGVARRTALTARRQAKTRLMHERETPNAGDPGLFPTEQAELRGCLDEEIGRLPAKYRAPVVLCYVEGRTVDQAAIDLAWPRGSVAGRLARAKEILRHRLTRRGFAMAAVVGLDTALVAEAAMPLAREQARQILHATLASGSPATGQIPASVASLLAAVERAMYISKFSWIGWSLGVLALLGLMGFTATAMLPAGQDKAVSGNAVPTDPSAIPQEWWLELIQNGQHLAMRPDGAESRELPPVKPERAIWAPDRTRMTYAQSVRNVRQIFEVENETGRKTQVTSTVLDAHMPQYHPSGTLAYIIDRERSGKVMLGDLVLHGAPPQVLVSRDYITGYAFSPDGTRLAYSTFGTLTVKEIATGKEQHFKVKDVNPQWNVSFHQPHWRPDGKAIAVDFIFLGGVVVGPDGKGPNIPGQGQVAVLPLEGGKITSIEFTKEAKLLGWCDRQGNPAKLVKTALPKVGQKDWWLVVHGSKHAWAVSAGSGELRKAPPFSIGAGPDIVRSPDGKRQASVDVQNKVSQVVERDLQNDQQKRISHPQRHATKPRYHPDGILAYLEEVQEEKPWPAPVNLMFAQGGQSWPFIRDKVILDYAFSPNGRFLASCCPDEVVVHDLQTGTSQKFPRREINPNWTAVFASLLWQPDSQALAVKMNNLDRMRQRDVPALGDDHAVLFVIGGKPRAVKLERDYDLGFWLDGQELKKWQQEPPGRK